MGQPRLAALQMIGCPRCGYDQRGVVAAWMNSCPLNGVCAECGLGFEWAEILNDDIRLPRWCVEYSTSILNEPRRTLATLLMTLRPWRFWNELKMNHAARKRRLWAYVVFILFVCYAFFAVGQGVIALQWCIDKSVSLPPSESPLHAMMHAIVNPFHNDLPVPNCGRLFPWTRNLTPYDALPSWRAVAETALVIALIMIACPLAFAALPISRRRAKVRAIHLVRAGIYAFALVLPFVFGGSILAVLMNTANYTGWQVEMNQMFFQGGAGALILLLPFLYLWWWMAAKRYLRMEHSALVAAAVVTIGFIAGLMVTWLCGSDYVEKILLHYFFHIRRY